MFSPWRFFSKQCSSVKSRLNPASFFLLKYYSRHCSSEIIVSHYIESGWKAYCTINNNRIHVESQIKSLLPQKKIKDLLSHTPSFNSAKGNNSRPRCAMLGKGKEMCLLYEAGVEYCHNWGQVNNILMSSNKKSKAIEKEKITSRVIMLYLIYPESKGHYWMGEEDGCGRGKGVSKEYWISGNTENRETWHSWEDCKFKILIK